MTFIEAIKNGFAKYATFNGRARRSEYWWWVLFTILAGLVLGSLDGILFGAGGTEFSPLSSIFSLATFIPSIAVLARRLHDTDRSGWWQIAPLSTAILTAVMIAIGANILALAAGVAALVCSAMVLFWAAKVGSDGDNRFGSDPLGGTGSDPDGGSYSQSSIPKV